MEEESEHIAKGRYGARNQGKLLSSRRSSRRFSVGGLTTSDSSSSILSSYNNYFNRKPRLIRTNSLSEGCTDSWLVARKSKIFSDSNEFVEQRDFNCDTNENEVLANENRVVDNILTQLLNGIPEKQSDDDDNVSDSSLDNINTQSMEDENNNPIPCSLSHSQGTCLGCFLFLQKLNPG